MSIVVMVIWRIWVVMKNGNRGRMKSGVFKDLMLQYDSMEALCSGFNLGVSAKLMRVVI